MTDPAEFALASEMNVAQEPRLRLLERLAPLLPLSILPVALGMSFTDNPGAAIALTLTAWMMAFGAAITAVPIAALLSQTHAQGWLTVQAQHRFEVWDERNCLGSWSWEDVALAWPLSSNEVMLWMQDGVVMRLRCRTLEDTTRVMRRVAAHRRKRRAFAIGLEATAPRLVRKMLAWSGPLCVASFALIFGPMYLPIVGAALALGWLGAKGTSKIEFGADGLVIHGRFRRRFIPYREIERVDTYRVFVSSLRLTLQSGERVRVSATDLQQASILKALIEEGREMAKCGADVGAEVGKLRRDGQSDYAWRARLSGALNDQGYRRDSLDPERLMTLMRNPAAQAEQRVAAALALRSHPEGVQRIRVAASVSAEPEVKEALETLAQEEVDEQRVSRVLRRIR